jgi:hypothetical protein
MRLIPRLVWTKEAIDVDSIAARSLRLNKWSWLALWLGIGAMLSLKLKQDGLWDTKNYHIYNVWAWLVGRHGRDIAAASLQSYFNPLPDLPYFVLATGPLDHWPRLLAALQGLWFGALGYLILRISFRLAQFQGRKPGSADVIATIIGVSGTMAVSQAGSTTNEIMLAWLVLLGFYLLMPLFQRETTARLYRSAALAGLFCGLAAGLKPTAIVYPPALCLALLCAPRSAEKRLALAAAFTILVIIGFLASYGWWGWHLYQLTGNPVFPMFNQLFHSDLIPPVGNTDHRFLPRDIAQWLFYPFFWLRNRADIVNEPAFSDPRYALAMLSLLLLPFATLLKGRRTRGVGVEPLHPVVWLVIVFTVVSYVLWLVLFSILRYAIPIEALTGILMLIAVQAILSHAPNKPAVTSRHKLVLLLLLVLAAATTHYPKWGRVPFGAQAFQVNPGNVPSNSLVLLGGIPSAYIAPFFANAQKLDFIGLNWFVQSSHGYRLWNNIQQRISAQQGPIYIVLRSDEEQSDIDLLQTFLPNHVPADCHLIQSNLDSENSASTLKLCTVIANSSLQTAALVYIQ